MIAWLLVIENRMGVLMNLYLYLKSQEDCVYSGHLSEVNSFGTIVSIRVSKGGRYTFIGISISEIGRGGKESSIMEVETVAFFEDPQLTSSSTKRIDETMDVSLMNFIWMD